MNKQNGNGLTREPGKLPPSTKSLLNRVKDEKISSITVYREPVEISKFLKYVKLNKHYDDLFHTGMTLNGKYNLEKNEYIKLYHGKPRGETLNVPVKSNITIGDLFEKTRKRMGDKNFTEYDVTKNNCQNFIMNVLKATGNNNPEAQKFISQDIEKVVESLGGKYAKALADISVKAKQIVNKLQEGEGSIFGGCSGCNGQCGGGKLKW